MPRSRRFLLFFGLAVLAGGALFLFLRPAPKNRRFPRRSVLLVTLDTLRPDFVGPGSKTPALHAFLSKATRFRGARTQVPLTLPSHLTLLSGLSPAHHGLHDNAPALPVGKRTFPLLAEQAKAAGYDTAAFVSAPVLGSQTGIGAGFSTFDDTYPKEPWGYCEAGRRVVAAVDWLAHARHPFFLWVHFYDLHDPYRAYSGGPGRPGTKAGDPPRVRYAGELRRVDEALARLFAAVPKDAIVVVASDHGEGLGEHGEMTHGFLCYSSTLDVLLAVKGPDLAPGGEDSAPRSLCDVAPTLRKWCGWPEAATDGKPLDGPGHHVVVSESMELARMHGWGQCFAATDGRYTLVESGPRVELFDRSRDPHELSPLPLTGSPAYQRLDTALSAYRRIPARGDLEYVPSVTTPYSSGVRPESGYLTRAENAARPDPRAHLKDWQELEDLDRKAESAFHERDREALLETIVKVEALGKTPLYAHDPSLSYTLCRADRLMAKLTHNVAYAAAAARNAREAVERGYKVAPVARQALECALDSGNISEIEAALRLVAREPIAPDLACAAAAAHAARLLANLKHPDALRLGRSVLERAARYVSGDAEKKRLRELEDLLK